MLNFMVSVYVVQIMFFLMQVSFYFKTRESIKKMHADIEGSHRKIKDCEHILQNIMRILPPIRPKSPFKD